MTHTRLWIAATIIAPIVLTGFLLSVPRAGDVLEVSELPIVTNVPLVTLRDTFKKNLHTITGSIEAPNACTTVTTEASIVGNASSTENILIAISMPSDKGVCLQLPTRVTFQTTISAAAQLPIIVTVNGAPATVSSI